MKFADVRDQLQSLKRQIQEVQSTAYAVVPFDDQYRFICYLDTETLSMGYALTDDRFVEIKLLSDVPPPVMIGFGSFVADIEAWQSNPEHDFPYSGFAGQNIPQDGVIRSEFEFAPNDHDVTADEAELK